jgi:hypothetical protein
MNPFFKYATGHIMTLRDWATPLTIGSFTLIAITGVLMFFHLDTGLNKAAHEWLGWALLAGVILHASVNLGAFKRYFQRRGAQLVIGLFIALLGLSFVSLPGSESKPPYIKATEALLAAPVSVVAQVAGKDTQFLLNQFRQAGIQVTAEQNLAQTLGDDRKQRMRALSLAFKR